MEGSRRWTQQQPKRQERMREPGRRQKPRARAVVRPEGRHGRRHQRHEDQKQFIHSRSTVSFRVSSESNARWMRSTMMPVTNTATVRSSRMPPSTSNGVEWISSRPKR